MSTLRTVALSVVLLGGLMVVGAYLHAVFDRVIGGAVAGSGPRVGTALVGPLRRAAQLMVAAPGVTERPDRVANAAAPALMAGLAAVALATVPFSPDLIVADTSTGFVLYSAAVGFVMVAVFLHGWGPNSPFALHGAYRYPAQSLSLQVPFLTAMLATTLPAESLQISEIVRSQEELWNVVRQPLGLPIYLLVGLGVPSWGPLNLPDGEDVAGGTTAEHGGIGLLLWKAAEAAMLVAVAAMGVAAFLGGWWGPGGASVVWTALKTIVLLALLVGSRHLVARLPLERLIVACWVVLLPLALINLVIAGVWLL